MAVNQMKKIKLIFYNVKIELKDTNLIVKRKKILKINIFKIKVILFHHIECINKDN
jgi:hypothetical protein